MKSITVVIAILSMIIFFDSCSTSPSSPVAPVGENVLKVGEGGSHPDTLSIDASDVETAYVFEAFGEGGSHPDTLFLKPKTKAKFYKIKDFIRKKKP